MRPRQPRRRVIIGVFMTTALIICASPLCHASELQFSSPTYSVNEGNTATITVTRTNGSVGVVKVDYCVYPSAFDEGSLSSWPSISGGNGDFPAYTSRIRGAGAQPPVKWNWDTAAAGTLQFNDGETSKTFTVPINLDGVVEGTERLSMILRNCQGGAVLGTVADAKLAINDVDAPAGGVLQFSSPLNHVTSTAGSKTITVTRTGGSTGTVSVSYSATGAAITYLAYNTSTQANSVLGAIAGTDFTTTSGTLTWLNGDTTPKSFTVQILDNGVPNDGSRNVALTLSSPSTGAALGSTKKADLYIVDTNSSTYRACHRRGTSYALTGWYEAGTSPLRIAGCPLTVWVPPNTPVIRGILMTGPSARAYSTNMLDPYIQEICKTWGFATMAFDDHLWTLPEGNSPLSMGLIEDIFRQLGMASNHPELMNAPFCAEGSSSGAAVPVLFSLAMPDRALGFAANIGGMYRNEVGPVPSWGDDPYERFYDNSPMPEGVKSVPGLFQVGETDTLLDVATQLERNFMIEAYWRALRSKGGLTAFAINWATGHGGGPLYQHLSFQFLNEFIKARYPAGRLPGINPGERVPLNRIAENDGWVGVKPVLPPTPLAGQTRAPAVTQFLTITPSASYTGTDRYESSWLPSEAAARAYQGHSSLIRPNVWGSVPVQTPLNITAPVLLTTPANSSGTDPVMIAAGAYPVTVNPRTFSNLSSLEFYDGSTKIGQLNAPQTTWSVSANMAPGIRSLSVVGTNSSGVKAASFMMFICTGTASGAPVISQHPASVTVTVNQSATFGVVASGTALTYQWMKNGVAITGANAATYTLAAAQATDAGSYTVTVSNSFGNVTSTAATLTVNPVVVPPSITTQPANKSVFAGQSAAFSVAATGTNPLTYQWKKNGTVISGATAATFTIASAQASDAGSYTVTVSNSAGNVTSAAATLMVTPVVVPPSITTHPANKSVSAGQSAAFGVVAAGTAPLAYQWMKNGIPISGANAATFTIPTALMSDAGSYTVTVSNSAGSVTSNAAILTVLAINNPPTITSGPIATPNPAKVGDSIAFLTSGADADGNPLTYAWNFGDGATGTGSAVSHTYSSTGVYTATVVVSDGSLSATGSVMVTIEIPPVSDLRAHWPLDETSGLQAADVSGNNIAGTLMNNPIWTPAKIAGGLKFNGTSSYVDCGNRPELNLADQITLSAWVNSSDGAPGTSEVIIAKDNRTTPQYSLRIQGGSGSKVWFGISGVQLSGTTSLKPNTWYHVAATYDGAMMKLYVNGVLDGTLAKTGVMIDGGAKVRIGARDATSPLYFNGWLDDVRIYARALNNEQIQNLQAPAIAAASAPAIAGDMTITKFGAMVDLTKENSASGTIFGEVISDVKPVAGSTITLDLDGEKVIFPMDARGKGRNNLSTIRVTVKGSKISFKVRLKNEKWTENKVPGDLQEIKVNIELLDQLFSTTLPVKTQLNPGRSCKVSKK
jgi:hypothetical protein